MPITAEKLNHLNTYARTCEQLSTAAATYYPLDDPARVEEVVKVIKDVLEEMDAMIDDLLAPGP